MSKKTHMTLAEWMAEKGWSLRDAAVALEAGKSTVALWRDNKSVPRRDAMAKIVAATGGAVRPESFYLGEDAA